MRVPLAALAVLVAPAVCGADLGEVPLYHVVEVEFSGPEMAAADTPARIRPSYTANARTIV